MLKKVVAIIVFVLVVCTIAGCTVNTTTPTATPTPLPTPIDYRNTTTSASAPPFTWAWRGMLTDYENHLAHYVITQSWSDYPENESVQHMHYVIYDARNGTTITADLKAEKFKAAGDATKYVDNNSAGYSPSTGDSYFASNHTELSAVYFVGGHGYDPTIIRTFERVESQSPTEIRASIIDQIDEYVVYGTVSVAKQ